MKKNEQQFTSPKQFLKTISIIYYAILLGPLGFLAMQYFQVTETKLELTSTKNQFQYIILILAVMGYYFGNRIYNYKLKELKNKKTLLEKLAYFQTGFIIKIALLEGPALLGIVAFSLNGNLFFLIIAGILLLIITLQKPTKQKVEAVLNLTMKQRSEFNKPNEILQ